MMIYLTLLFGTVSNAIAGLLLKLLANDSSSLVSLTTLKNPLFYFSLLAFSGSFLGYALFLQHVDLAVGYPAFVGTTFMIVLTLSFFFLKETLLLPQIIGIILIFGGILLATR